MAQHFPDHSGPFGCRVLGPAQDDQVGVDFLGDLGHPSGDRASPELDPGGVGAVANEELPSQDVQVADGPIQHGGQG